MRKTFEDITGIEFDAEVTTIAHEMRKKISDEKVELPDITQSLEGTMNSEERELNNFLEKISLSSTFRMRQFPPEPFFSRKF